MEVGAAVILALVFVALIAVGVTLYGMAWRLHHEKLHPGDRRMKSMRGQSRERDRPEHQEEPDHPNRSARHGD